MIKYRLISPLHKHMIIHILETVSENNRIELFVMKNRI